jgi:hypothetical protein
VERNAADAKMLETCGNDADGEVVWSWRQEHFLNYFNGKFPFKSAGPD